MTVVVLGFGAFGSVPENPSARIARAVDGLRIGAGNLTVVGRVMPVSYARSYEFTRSVIAEVQPVFVLGIGVATGREGPMVERVGRNVASATVPDVDDTVLTDHGAGAPTLECDWAAPLAAALRLPLSDDAGEYVCNSWLYRVLRAELPAAFLHVPLSGYAPEALAAGLGRFFDAAALG